MKALTLACIIYAITLNNGFAADEEQTPELSAATLKKKLAYEQDVNDLVNSVQRDYKKLREKYIKVLEKEIKNATKRGQLDNALAIKAEIKKLKAEEPIADLFGNITSIGDTYIEIMAKDYARSANNPQREHAHWDMLFLDFKEVTYDTKLPHSGEFYFHIHYTSGEARPLKLYFNEQEAEKALCTNPTGGWHKPTLAWASYGPYKLPAGPISITIKNREGHIASPHINKFVITNQKTPKVEAKKE